MRRGASAWSRHLASGSARVRPRARVTLWLCWGGGSKFIPPAEEVRLELWTQTAAQMALCDVELVATILSHALDFSDPCAATRSLAQMARASTADARLQSLRSCVHGGRRLAPTLPRAVADQVGLRGALGEGRGGSRGGRVG